MLYIVVVYDYIGFLLNKNAILKFEKKNINVLVLVMVSGWVFY